MTVPLEYRRFKVTVEDSSGSARLFVAAGDTVRYAVNEVADARPPALPGRRWPKKITRTHTLTWETVTYE